MRFKTSVSATRGAETLRLWEQYRESGDPRLRDRLVLTFAPLVKYLVLNKLRELPVHVRVEEFISSGLEALIRSLDAYDPAKGAPLEQFLTTRIRGAILDELRRQDPAPRSLRRRERELDRAHRDFRAGSSRSPNVVEICKAAAITEQTLHKHRQDLHVMGSVESLNALVGHDDGGALELGDLLVGAHADPEAAAFAGADREALAEALATLSPRERTVIGLLYFEEMTLREVGEVIGVSESRVCQMSGNAKRRLHEHMAAGCLIAA